jgi:hypothetical protein
MARFEKFHHGTDWVLLQSWIALPNLRWTKPMQRKNKIKKKSVSPLSCRIPLRPRCAALTRAVIVMEALSTPFELSAPFANNLHPH